MTAACGSGGDGGADGGGDPDGGGGLDSGGGFDASVCPDADSDGVCDSVDACPGFDDSVDTDGDGTPNGCDVCMPGDDMVDTDSDGVPDDCDVCAGFDDAVDTDSDNVPNGCDVCAGFDDTIDSDNDAVPDGCDVCTGFDDGADSDDDGVANGCDICDGFDDAVDPDDDGVPSGCDQCEGADDGIDIDDNGVPDGCETICGPNEVGHDGICYYLDGSGGECTAGFTLAPQSILTAIAADFIGLTYKTEPSSNCCIWHRDQAAELQDWGLASPDCNGPGPFSSAPVLGGAGCADELNLEAAQLTLCQSIPCDPATEVEFDGRCYYLDGSGGTCEPGYVLAPQSVLTNIAPMFVGKDYKNQISSNCCISHADQSTELQDWGMDQECNTPGPFTQGPVLGGAGCTDIDNNELQQLTLCVSAT